MVAKEQSIGAEINYFLYINRFFEDIFDKLNAVQLINQHVGNAQRYLNQDYLNAAIH